MRLFLRLALLIVILTLAASCQSLFKFRKAGIPSENDYKYFPSREIAASSEPFYFKVASRDLQLGKNIELDSRKIDAYEYRGMSGFTYTGKL